VSRLAFVFRPDGGGSRGARSGGAGTWRDADYSTLPPELSDMLRIHRTAVLTGGGMAIPRKGDN